MKKEISLVPYDPSWKTAFEVESANLKNVLKQNCTHIYHIGSTSVPGLCAKPKIDVICVVKDLKETISPLESAGYEYRGEFNVPMKFFFSKRAPRDINLHVLTSDNGELAWNLTFRDYLRNNKSARDEYANAKLSLVGANPSGFDLIPNMFSTYTANKGKTINQIAKAAGFKGERFVIAVNPNEIDAYDRLIGDNGRNEGVEPSNVFKLVLYKNMDIVAAARVELVNKDSYNIIKLSGIDENAEDSILKKISDWTNLHGRTKA